VEVEYPLGHPQRRQEAMPLLEAKFRDNVQNSLGAKRAAVLCDVLWERRDWVDWPVNRFVEWFLPTASASDCM